MLGIIDDELLNFDFESGASEYYLKDCKPLLMPLVKLSTDQLKEIIKHLFRDSQMIRPDHNRTKCESGFITIYDNNTMQRYTVVKPGGLNLPVLNMSNHYTDYNVFFKLHVDMFGLLEKGLAIDKTLTKQAVE